MVEWLGLILLVVIAAIFVWRPRIMFSTGNIFLSLVLGALAFGFVFLNYPETMRSIFAGATTVKAWLVNQGLSSQYNNWIDLLLEERQLVYMGFTIVMRLALSVLFAFGEWLTGMNYASPASPADDR